MRRHSCGEALPKVAQIAGKDGAWQGREVAIVCRSGII